jgi:hypothetical protein
VEQYERAFEKAPQPQEEDVCFYGSMALQPGSRLPAKKMTFSLPAEIAADFMHRVPARLRSRFAADAIAARLNERDARLREAAAIVNASPEILALEKEWDALPDIEDELGIKNGCAFRHE